MRPTTLILVFAGLFLQRSAVFSQSTNSLETLKEGQKIQGFITKAIYTNDVNKPMGGRFVHGSTGFTLDLLQIESVPQAFIWVNSYPVSDKGEPHTQEHLLITKGSKGHQLNTREGMSLAVSNAFTSQLHTAYDFYTAAGPEVFYHLLEEYLDALLHPDYTSEEVNREVRNWGVTVNPSDKSMGIAEKGSVYNEMTTSMDNPYAQLFDVMGRYLYGNAHPLSFNAGGLPSGIRVLGPSDIQQFHDANYFLGNMGAIVSLSSSLKLNAVLSTMDSILTRLDPHPSGQKPADPELLKKKQPAETGKMDMVGFPTKNINEPGDFLFAWPADRTLSPLETVLLSNFLTVFAGDATTNLYKVFIDSKTRQLDIGAQGLFSYADVNEGRPVFIDLSGIPAANLNKEKADLARNKVMAELERIASFRDHSPELTAFNTRFSNSLTDYRRQLAKFINTPPKFGFRNTGDDWYVQLGTINQVQGFYKSILLKPQFAEIEKMLSAGTNFWTTYFRHWKLTGVKPYVLVSHPDSAMITIEDSARKTRTQEKLASLRQKYGVADDQQAIGLYKNEYDSNSAELARAEKAFSATFIQNPPLTLDDNLNFKQASMTGSIPVVYSTFDNMSGATSGLDIRLDGVSKQDLVYLAMLPELMTQTGVIKDGKAISYEDMTELLRQEIMSLEVVYAPSINRKLTEMVVRGAGNDPAESRRAIGWMKLVLQSPNWRSENLPRIRDLVDQQLNDLRKRMQNAEEAWVNDPAFAYEHQDNALMLATNSFLTQSHNVFRLRWMLKDAGGAENQKAINEFLSSLASVKASRADLLDLLGAIQSGKAENLKNELKSAYTSFEKLSAPAKDLAKDAASDLVQVLQEIPDGSLTEDWHYTCLQMQKDLAQTPGKTLAHLDSLRKSLLKTGNLRAFQIASAGNQQNLRQPMADLISAFRQEAFVPARYSSERMIDARALARVGSVDKPVFVGLINPNSKTGVFINSAPVTGYANTDRDHLLKYLAAALYAGAGTQSVYTKSTGAGLSYSTGVNPNPNTGRFSYYAERTPELPQTLQFVINEIKKEPVDPGLKEYVIAIALRGSRAAFDYETRGEAMAADLANHTTPDTIRHFRKAILQLRNQPGLIEDVYKRKDLVYEKILPGYGINPKEIQGGIYFVIGPEKQMALYDAYLKSTYGPSTTLYRLYPRDYWVIDQ